MKNTGLGLLDVLLIIFIVLKLLKIITWSWLWVLSPLWINIIVIVIEVIYFEIKLRR